MTAPAPTAQQLAEEAKQSLSDAMLAQADARDSGDYTDARNAYLSACRAIDALASLATAAPLGGQQGARTIRIGENDYLVKFLPDDGAEIRFIAPVAAEPAQASTTESELYDRLVFGATWARVDADGNATRIDPRGVYLPDGD